MHEEDAVGDVDDLDAVHGAGGPDDLLPVLGRAGVDGDVADDLVAADADDVDGADVAAGPPDGDGQLAERPRPARKLDAQGQAVTRARRVLRRAQGEGFLSGVTSKNFKGVRENSIAKDTRRARQQKK
jgi:hypothetical protein